MPNLYPSQMTAGGVIQDSDLFYAQRGNEAVAITGAALNNSTSPVNEQNFETITQNLKSYPYSTTFNNNDISQITYITDTGSITKNYSYDGNGNITTITLSGDLPSAIIQTTKNFTYDPNNNLTGVTYS